MKILYIGEYLEGSTSKYRSEQLRKILEPGVFQVIAMDIPVNATSRVFRSLGWRYKRGPLVGTIAAYVRKQLLDDTIFDLIWVDKADLLSRNVVELLRRKAKLLVHYTPDNAFYSNKSPLFLDTVRLFDFCVTTKSFEVEQYYKAGARKVISCTQGYNPDIHHPGQGHQVKEGVVFVGLHESYREKVISSVLKENFVVKLGGVGWSNFISKNKDNKNLVYLGEKIFSEDYSAAIRSSVAGLGLLSKRFPEKHTTRTMEIPACGTVLVTERNEETIGFFKDGEACFFDSESQIPGLIRELLADPDKCSGIGLSGFKRVSNGGFDNESILRRILQETGILQ